MRTLDVQSADGEHEIDLTLASLANGEYQVELAVTSPAGKTTETPRIQSHELNRLWAPGLELRVARSPSLCPVYAYIPRIRVTVATRLMATM